MESTTPPPPAETKKQLERQDSLDTVKSTNVLQCSIPCADMWYETDRQAVHADIQIMQREERSQTRQPKETSFGLGWSEPQRF